MENKSDSTNGFGIACLVLGIVGMLTTCLFFGIIPCILSLIFGFIGVFQKNKSKTTSIIGIACSTIGILLFICIIVAVNYEPKEKTPNLQNEKIETNIDTNDETILETENITSENKNEVRTEKKVVVKEETESTEYFFAILLVIVFILIFGAVSKNTSSAKLPKYDGKTPVCPRCGKSHYHSMVTQEVVVPEKTKTQSSLNLNPLKPFTVMNHKQKVVQREISREVVRFVCDECGNIWN